MDENTMDTAMDAEIDAAWNDEDTGVEVLADQPDTDTEAAEDQQEPTEAEPSEDVNHTQEGEEKAADQQPKLYALRHKDDPIRNVTAEEMIPLAQKGIDYDDVRAERDQLRAYKSEAESALALVDAYAAKCGMNRSQYIDACRKQEIMDTGVNEQTAEAQIQNEKWEAQRAAQTRAEQEAAAVQRQKADAEARRAAYRRQDMERFLGKYPDVKPDTIPQEVWGKVAAGETLTGAYTEFENQRLKSELAARDQNKKNRDRAPGSLGGNSGDEIQNTIDMIFDEDD